MRVNVFVNLLLLYECLPLAVYICFNACRLTYDKQKWSWLYEFDIHAKLRPNTIRTAETYSELHAASHASAAIDAACQRQVWHLSQKVLTSA